MTEMKEDAFKVKLCFLNVSPKINSHLLVITRKNLVELNAHALCILALKFAVVISWGL